MTKDDLAKRYGFEVVDSEYEYYKKFVRNVHLVVYYNSWTDSKWQVKLMEHDGGIYFAMKEIDRFEALEDALKAANKLNPGDLKSLISNDDEVPKHCNVCGEEYDPNESLYKYICDECSED